MKVKYFNTFLILLFVVSLGFSANIYANSQEIENQLPLDDKGAPCPLLPEPETDSITLSLGSLPLQIQQKGEYQSVNLAGSQLLHRKPGEPVISVITRKILLPQGQEVTSVILNKSGKQTYNNVYLEPAQPAVPLPYQIIVDNVIYSQHYSEKEFIASDYFNSIVEDAFNGEIPGYFLDEDGNVKVEYFKGYLPNPEVYESDRPYPENDYEIVSVQEFRGYKILVLNIFPVKYLPKARKIEYYADVSFTVKTQRIPNYELPQSFRGIDEQEVKQRVDNFEKLSTYQALSSEPGPRPMLGSPPTNYEYVIITTQEYAPYFQPLINWKTSRPNNPITATIVDVESILSDNKYKCNSHYIVSLNPDYADNHCNAPGHNSDEAKIRNFIRDAYVNWNTEYVLLAFDSHDEGGFSIVLYDPVHEKDIGILSDLYFGCLDGSFDENANGVFGEKNDGINSGELDLFAEVYVGRAPVHTAEEIGNFIQKTIDYEQANGEYLNQVLMVGEHLGFGGVANYATDMLEEVIMGSCNHNYCTAGLYKNYLTDGLYDSPVFKWNKNELIGRINQGVHFINHLGHANVNGVMKIATDDMSRLSNSQYPLIYSQGCYSASFDDIEANYGEPLDESMGERFLLYDIGAFAYIGNSRYGWGRRGSTDGPSQRFHRQFVDTIIGDDINNLARANQISKENNLWGLENNNIRYVYYELNLLGDPETEIKKPSFTVPITVLTEPAYQDTVNDTIELKGVAIKGPHSSATFSHYTVKWGEETSGTTVWHTEGITLENNGQQPVDKGLLGSFDTRYAPETNVVLALTAFDNSGQYTATEVPLKINNIVLHNIHDKAFFPLNSTIPIEASINNNYLTDFSISITDKDGANHDEAISYTGEMNGVVANLDTSLVEKGKYELTFTFHFSVYPTITEKYGIYLDLYKENWPVNIPYEKCGQYYYWPGMLEPSVGNVDADPEKELIFHTGGCPPKLRIFDLDGTQTIYELGNIGSAGLVNKPLVVDIDNDGEDEILVYALIDTDTILYAFNKDGTQVPGWPVDTEVGRWADPGNFIAADLDLDGTLEIIFKMTHSDQVLRHDVSKLFIITPEGTISNTCIVGESNVMQPIPIYGMPSVGNFDDDPELEIYTSDIGYNHEVSVRMLNHDLSILPGWPRTVTQLILSSGAVGDVDNDGKDEVVQTCYGGDVYLFDDQGVVWSRASTGSSCSASLGDFDNDGYLEIGFSERRDAEGRGTYLLNHEGEVIPGWPVATVLNDIYGTTIANIDHDQDPELITTVSKESGGDLFGGVYAWDFDGTLLTGFPLTMNESGLAAAHIADIDNDGNAEIIASADWRKPYIYVWDLGIPYIHTSNHWPMYKHDPLHTGKHNFPPKLEPISNKTFYVGKRGGFEVVASDAEDDAVEFKCLNLPQGAGLLQWNKTDINKDGIIDDEDVSIFNLAYNTAEGNPSYDIACDFNDDGRINLTDFSVLGEMYGQTLNESPRFNTAYFGWRPFTNQTGTHNIRFMVSDNLNYDTTTVKVTVLNRSGKPREPKNPKKDPRELK